jgi:hypothetical protein
VVVLRQSSVVASAFSYRLQRAEKHDHELPGRGRRRRRRCGRRCGRLALETLIDSDHGDDPDDRLPGVGTRAATPEEELELIGNRWAASFAAGKNSCADMSQPLCERIACERVGGRKIRNCRPPTSKFRKSFDEAVVRGIAFKKHRAAARFSNGEVVEFSGDGGAFMVTKIGANAGRGFFE